MTQIHKTAIVDDKAKIGKDVIIGPYSVIDAGVTLGDSVEIKSHVVVSGATKIGDGTVVFPFASIGNVPQDKKYHGENSELIIGANNIFREYVTVNPGTEGGGMITKIGDNCLFMANSHIAHDCIIGNNAVIANSVAIAGHVVVEDHVTIGGLSAVHRRVRIGKHAMIGGMSAVDRDVIPFGIVLGERAFLNGLNIIGLKRRGFSKNDIMELRIVYDRIFTSEFNETFEVKLKRLSDEFVGNDNIKYLLDFLQESSKRAFCQPK